MVFGNLTLLESESNFALNLLTAISTTDESLVFSPLSVSLALALVHSGAEGGTKKQITNVLLGNVSDEQFVVYFGKISRKLQAATNGVETDIANCLFADISHRIKEEYLETIKTIYNSEAVTLNFSEADKSAQKVNKFVLERTSGKITNLVDAETFKNAYSLLISAVYFKADWLEKFDRSSTSERHFFTSETVSRPVMFMNEVNSHRDYTDDSVFQVLSLCYADSSYSFVIFLPKIKHTLKDALKKLDGNRFQSLLSDLKNSYVTISIPKFKIEKEIDLKEQLEKLKIRDIFSEHGDLSGLAENLRISSGKHKSLIEVGEDGTTAGATTLINTRLEMMIMAKPIQFVADHPFFFAVLKDTHPIFMGVHY